MERRAEQTKDSPSNLINFAMAPGSTEHVSKQPENSLLMDTGENDPKRIMIFCRKKTSEAMGFVTKLYVDTSLERTPPPFAQVLIVVAERAIYTLPLAYILLTDTTVDSYTRMFSFLRDAWPALDPKVVFTNFDRALLDGANACFPPQTCIRGSFRALLEHIKLLLAASGLWPRYRKGGDFSRKTRMIAALAFVPPSELSSALSALESVLPRDLVPVFHAFEDKFTGRLNVSLPDGTVSTKEPQFPIEVWSIYQRVLDGEDWVVDHAKETRRRLRVDLCNETPFLSEFTEAIRREQGYVDFERVQYSIGNAYPKRELTATDKRIIEIVRDAGKKPHLEYLMTIARSLAIRV